MTDTRPMGAFHGALKGLARQGAFAGLKQDLRCDKCGRLGTTQAGEVAGDVCYRTEGEIACLGKLQTKLSVR